MGGPALVALAATLVLGTPLRVFGLSLPEPVFPMVLAFAWPMIRPSVLGPFILLGCGFLLDLFWGDRPGLWGLSLLIAYAGALVGRSLLAGQGPGVLWGWYAAVVATAFGAAYLFVMLATHVAPDPTSVLLQSVVTVALFPFARRLIERFEDADVRFK